MARHPAPHPGTPARARLVPRRYARCWAAVWWPAGALVATVGLVLGGPADAVGSGLAGAVTGALIARVAQERRRLARGALVGGLTRLLVSAPVGRVAVVAGLAAAGLRAGEAVLGPAVWPTAALAVTTSPTALAAARRRWPLRRTGRGADLGSEDDAGRAEELSNLLRHLSDEQLSRGWVETRTRVRAATTPADLEQVAALRRAWLGELERRHPRAVSTWLADPDAAHGPDRWLGDAR